MKVSPKLPRGSDSCLLDVGNDVVHDQAAMLWDVHEGDGIRISLFKESLVQKVQSKLSCALFWHSWNISKRHGQEGAIPENLLGGITLDPEMIMFDYDDTVQLLGQKLA